MAQLMQGCGLQRQGRAPWIEQHLDPWFGLPAAAAINQQQLQQGTAIAGPGAAIGQALQRWSAAPDAHLGLIGIGHAAQAEQLAPGRKSCLDGVVPAQLLRCGGTAGRGLKGLDPDAPVIAHRPAHRRGLQLVAVISVAGCSQGCRGPGPLELKRPERNSCRAL